MSELERMLSARREESSPTLLMGILNVTPDSFYDGGEYDTSARALERAREMVENGADLLDVGGESTRPGAEPVALEEEKDRIIPVVESIDTELSVPVSVDTTKPEVAAAALDAGADMINDISGLENPDLRSVVAGAGCPVCIMHMQGTPRTMQENPRYDDVVRDVAAYLRRQADRAIEAGIDREKIILDPGIGFGKSLEHNRKLLNSVGELRDRGFLVLVGHSRKSFIGEVLGNDVSDRLAATLGVSVELLHQDVDLLRVHDVREHADVARITEWMRTSEDHDG